MGGRRVPSVRPHIRDRFQKRPSRRQTAIRSLSGAWPVRGRHRGRCPRRARATRAGIRRDAKAARSGPACVAMSAICNRRRWQKPGATSRPIVASPRGPARERPLAKVGEGPIRAIGTDGSPWFLARAVRADSASPERTGGWHTFTEPTAAGTGGQPQMKARQPWAAPPSHFAIVMESLAAAELVLEPLGDGQVLPQRGQGLFGETAELLVLQLLRSLGEQVNPPGVALHHVVNELPVEILGSASREVFHVLLVIRRRPVGNSDTGVPGQPRQLLVGL